MKYESLLSQLCEELLILTKGRTTVGENTELVGDLALDSLQVMDLLLLMEDRFDISIPVSILPDVKTVRDLAIQVEKLVSNS